MADKEFEKFEKTFDKVCLDIMDKHSPTALSMSGGVDSTAIALGLLKTKKPFYILHMNHTKRPNSNQHKFEHMLVYEFSMKYGVPLLMIHCDHLIKPSFIFKEIGITTFITGDGMDRCYGLMDCSTGEKEPTFGEDFHCKHPIIDKLFKTIPSRRKFYMTPYAGIDMEHRDDMEIAKRLDMEIIKFIAHPLFVSFFEEYKHNVRDMVYPKLLTYKYVKNNLDMDYYKFCRMVMKKHYGSFTNPCSRIINNWRKNK